MTERARIVVSSAFTGLAVAIAEQGVHLPASEGWAVALATLIVAFIVYGLMYWAIGESAK